MRGRHKLSIPVGGVGSRLLHEAIELLGEGELVAGAELLAGRLRALHELLSEAELVAGRLRALLHEQPSARTAVARVADSGTGRRGGERMTGAGPGERDECQSSAPHGRPPLMMSAVHALSPPKMYH